MAIYSPCWHLSRLEYQLPKSASSPLYVPPMYSPNPSSFKKYIPTSKEPPEHTSWAYSMS
ncbi:hypothetical protein EMPG_17358 [Blastomyces silverae]|uniref:Uncharacterized protein n=1 Tax=Blastomyces silverae TaxID=2060906 RepID=A0A0H1B6S6_9EURO|nr:hypothetical protein EMPG_17358 [Blastomyces silverae]